MRSSVQKIRYVQAKAWVEQAKYILEANEIALREYEAGSSPRTSSSSAITSASVRPRESKRNGIWPGRGRPLPRGSGRRRQVDADAAMFQQAEIALRDAEGMLTRLVKYTGKRILKARRAKIEAIHADLLSLESSFRLETERSSGSKP